MLVVSCLVAEAAVPQLTDFNTNQFGTAGGIVTIKNGALVTNLVGAGGTVTSTYPITVTGGTNIGIDLAGAFIFDTNQFSVTAVTNISIASGALVTNLTIPAYKTNLLGTDASGIVTNITLGTGLTLTGTTLSGHASDNWTASGTTNSSLIGVGSVNGIVATNSVTIGSSTLTTDGDNILALRNGVIAQTNRIYNNWTNASNGEWASLSWNNNIFGIKTLKNGGGILRELDVLSGGTLVLGGGGTGTWEIFSTGHQVPIADNSRDLGDVNHFVRSGYFKTALYAPRVQVTKTTNYVILSTELASTFNNIGAGATNRLDLPTAAAGLHYFFYVDAAQNMQVQAVGSDVIRDAATDGAAAGNIHSAVIGSTLHLFSPKAALWVVDAKTGTWTLE